MRSNYQDGEKKFGTLLNKRGTPQPPRFMKADIDTNIPTRAEIREAVKKLKNHKAPGYDELPAEELLRADIEQATEALSVRFEIIWEEEKIPCD